LKAELGKFGALGNTSAGGDWCLKALHPSDPICEVRGIPDHSAVPSVCMNYQTTYTVTPDPTWTGDTWEFDMAMLPHPIAFAWINSHPTGDLVHTKTNAILNSQIDATTHAGKAAMFGSLAERWRLAYAGVSIYQDGADLNNQGTIVVAQVPCEPQERTYHAWQQYGATPVQTLQYAYPPVQYWADDVPNFEASQGMPNAYFGRSKDGAYVPLKLTETCQDWSSIRDTVYYSDQGGISSLAPIPLPQATASGIYPFGDDDGAGHEVVGLQVAYSVCSATEQVVSGETTFKMLNGTFAHICARNLAKTTSYSFFFRYGIEMQVKPSSTLAPQMKLSPMYDSTALNAYFQIARELKDAYPVEYNDKGQLWGVIKNAARVALPMIAASGPYGKAAAAVGMGTIALGDAIQHGRMKSGERDRPPQAAVERQRERIARSVPPPLPPKPRKLRAAPIQVRRTAISSRRRPRAAAV